MSGDYLLIFVQIRIAKGQLISKGLFSVFNSSNKRTKKQVNLRHHSTVVRFFHSFFRRIQDTNKSFRNYLTFLRITVEKRVQRKILWWNHGYRIFLAPPLLPCFALQCSYLSNDEGLYDHQSPVKNPTIKKQLCTIR